MSESLEERYATLTLELEFIRDEVRRLCGYLDDGNTGKVRVWLHQLHRNVDSYCEQHPYIETAKKAKK